MEVEFYELRFLMDGNFTAKIYDRAQSWAERYLALAADNENNWNFGNAIHHANLILGRIALKEKNIEAAKSFLLKAADTSGSPQLNTFGPNMSLAKELLELGETSVVLEYIDLCAKFWRTQFQKAVGADEWTKQIEDGQIPDFKANLFY